MVEERVVWDHLMRVKRGPVLAVVTMGLSRVFCRSPFGGLLGSNGLPSDGY